MALAEDEMQENVRIDQLVDHAGIGNVIGASLDLLPENILERVVFMDVIRLHNESKAGSRIRRLARKELLGRKRDFYVWDGLYLIHAKRGTLLRKMSTVKMLETSSDPDEDLAAYEAIDHLAPEHLEAAAEKILGRAAEPDALRYVIKESQSYPKLNLAARSKLYKMFTL